MTDSTLRPGVWAVVATPFGDDLGLDLDSLRRLVGHYQSIGVAGLTVLGVFGEAAALSRAERDLVLATVADTVDLPLVVGMTSMATEPALEEAEATQRVLGDRLGALMVQVNSPQPDVVAAHLTRIVQHTDVPIVVQDYPVASGVRIPLPALRTVVESTQRVAAVKAESAPTPPAIAALADLQVPVFGGLGGIGLLDELACGSAGAMTGFSYPEALLACVQAYVGSGYHAARGVFAPYLPLVNFEQQAGIALAVRKECLRVRGLITRGRVRPPAAALPPSLTDLLHRHLTYVETMIDNEGKH